MSKHHGHCGADNIHPNFEELSDLQAGDLRNHYEALQSELAAARVQIALYLDDYEQLCALMLRRDKDLAALEKVAEAAVNLAKDKRPDTIYNPLLDNLEKALRSAGYLKEEGDE